MIDILRVLIKKTPASLFTVALKANFKSQNKQLFMLSLLSERKFRKSEEISNMKNFTDAELSGI